MNRSIKKSRLPIYIIPLLVVLILTPSFSAPAQAGLAEEIANATVGKVLQVILGAEGNLIALVGSWINPILSSGVTGVVVVENGWNTIRNFANMFFIIALIIMAFGTIFSISRYDVRTLIPRFLIAVLLINFSLVIGEIIIDWSQSLSNVFLTAIGDVGLRLADNAKLASQFDTKLPSGITDANFWTAIMSVFANIILLSIILFSMIVLLFFSIIRIPILWALLIVSPIAWVTYILPTTTNINRQWWKYFIGWNVFMPMYLFFVYFGILFLSKQKEILGDPGNSVLPGLGEAGAFQTIFFYVLTAIFLIGGAKVAMSSSMSAGAGGVAAGVWARGRATARFAGVGLTRRTPGIRQIEPAYKAAGQRIAQFGKDTEKALQQRQAGLAGTFGVRGAGEAKFNKDVDNATQEIKDKKIYDDKSALITKINSGTPEEKVAAYKLLKEFHQEEGNANQIKQVAEAFRSAGLTAQESKFMAGINYEKLSAEDLEKLSQDEYFNSATVAYRQQMMSKITDAQVKQGRYRDADSYKKLITKYTKEDDVLDALRKTDKDFLDSLSKTEYQDLFEEFGKGEGKKNMSNVEKILAERMLKKGYFSADDLKLVFADSQKGGLYDSDFERNRAMKSAEETRLMSTLRLRKDLGLFDKKEDGTARTYEEMLQDRVSRLGTDDLFKIKVDAAELNDGKKEEFLAAFKATLMRNPKTATKKVNSMIMHKGYTGEYEKLYGEVFDEILAETAGVRAKKKGGGGGGNTGGGPSGGGSPGPSPVPRRPAGFVPPSPEPSSTYSSPPLHMGGPTVIGGPPKTAPEPTNHKPDELISLPSSWVTDGKGTWRPVKEGEIFEPGREFRMDISGNNNYVKVTEEELKKFKK